MLGEVAKNTAYKLDCVYVQTPMWGEPPPDDATIWRYVSIPKLIHALQTKKLFFSSVSNLAENDDPWEGHWAAHEFQEVIAPLKNRLDLDWEKVMRDALKRSTFVRCWHQGDYESAAMWAIYGKESIALKSTAGSLKASFRAETRPVGVVAVKYTDLLPDVPPLIRAVVRKRPSFEHEHEIRAVIHDTAAQGQEGVCAQVDLETLVHGVYVNPLAPPGLRLMLRDVLKAELLCYGLHKSVEVSSMYDPL